MARGWLAVTLLLASALSGCAAPPESFVPATAPCEDVRVATGYEDTITEGKYEDRETVRLEDGQIFVSSFFIHVNASVAFTVKQLSGTGTLGAYVIPNATIRIADAGPVDVPTLSACEGFGSADVVNFYEMKAVLPVETWALFMICSGGPCLADFRIEGLVLADAVALVRPDTTNCAGVREATGYESTTSEGGYEDDDTVRLSADQTFVSSFWVREEASGTLTAQQMGGTGTLRAYLVPNSTLRALAGSGPTDVSRTKVCNGFGSEAVGPFYQMRVILPPETWGLWIVCDRGPCDAKVRVEAEGLV